MTRIEREREISTRRQEALEHAAQVRDAAMAEVNAEYAERMYPRYDLAYGDEYHEKKATIERAYADACDIIRRTARREQRELTK
jgi:hypothetical protein